MVDHASHQNEVVQDYVSWVNGNSSHIDVLSESIDVYNPGLPDGEVHRRSEFEAYLREIRTGFPDVHFVEEEVVARDDIVMVEFTITGTHDGEFQGLPPTDRQVEIRGVEKMRVADGKIQEIHVYYDTQEIPNQLGMTFPTVLGQLPKLAWRKIRKNRQSPKRQ